MNTQRVLSHRLPQDALLSLLVLHVLLITILTGCTTSTQLWQGDRLVEEGNYQGAVAQYLQIIRKHPGSEVARNATLRIARLYEEQLNRPDDAVQIYRDVTKRYTGSKQAQEALWLLGMHYYNRGEYTKALPRFVQLMMDFPRTPRAQEAHLQRAACYVKMERYQEALTVYEEYLRYYPESSRIPEILLRQADLYAQHMQRRDRAVARYRKLVEEYPHTEQAASAENRLEELGALAQAPPIVPEGGLREVGPPTRPNARQLLYEWQPSDVFGYNVRELLLGGEGMFGGEELQESLAGNGSLLDDAVYNMGLMFYMTQEYRKAGAALEKALELGIREANLYLRLGICYREVGEIKKAQAMFRELNQIDPGAVDRLIEEADRYRAEGRTADAQKRYESLRNISPDRDKQIERRLTKIVQE